MVEVAPTNTLELLSPHSTDTPQTPSISCSSIATSYRNRARASDPNGGKCLLTNQRTGVYASHLVPKRTRSETFDSLEYAWGYDYRTFNVDTRHNIIFLRADLQISFAAKDWILLPDVATIDYLLDMEGEFFRMNRRKKFEYKTETYTYYMMPFQSMEDVTITRDIEFSGHTTTPTAYESTHHRYPFSTLGPIRSHALPHYVIFHAGPKLLPLYHPLSLPAGMLELIRQYWGLETEDMVWYYFNILKGFYRQWNRKPPSGFTPYHHPKPFLSGIGDFPDWWPIHGRESTREGYSFSQGYHNSSVQDESLEGDEDMDEVESAVESANEVELARDVATSKAVVFQWLDKTVDAVARDGGWEPDVLNHGQLGSYVEEVCFPPGQRWRPTWMRRGLPDLHKPPPDTSRFSSNDWCLKDYFIRLTDPVDD